MKLEFKAKGTPSQVKNQVASEVKSAGRDNPAAWPTLVNLRDYLGAHLNEVSEKSKAEVEVSLSVSVINSKSEEEIQVPDPEPIKVTKPAPKK